MTSTGKGIRAAGLATGLALTALLVLAFRVPASERPLGAGLRVSMSLPGELEASSRTLLSEPGLVRGDGRARGEIELSSITSLPVRVRTRLRGARALDRLVLVELRAGRRLLASGPLGRLRRRVRSLELAPYEARTLRLTARLAPEANGFDGTSARVRLDLHARPMREDGP
jgi:hypothetical protein